MNLKNILSARFVPFLVLPIPLLFASTLGAAPRLNITGASAVCPPGLCLTVPAVQGTNAPSQFIDAFNIGNGKLDLTATSNVTWMTATVAGVQVCGLSGGCYPVTISFDTASLAVGTYTGILTLSDPGALDAPQSITVTVQVGGDVPSNLEFYLAPGTSTTTSFTTGSTVKASVSADTSWLTVSSSSSQGINTLTVKATASSSMAAKDYDGTITISGSKFAPDNKAISVLLHVTTGPIAHLSSTTLSLTIPQGAAKETVPVAVTNAGKGTLTVSSVTATATNGGKWLTATSVSGGVDITVDPTGLSPDTYSGTVKVASNADNGSVTIPVELTVVAQGPPLANAGGVVNNGTFANGEPVAQGDIVALFGSQFTYDAAQGATSLPLKDTMNGVQVLVNGKAAPLFSVSAGQIDFEIPIDASTANGGGGTVQVVRNGQPGNQVYVDIVNRAPRFILYGGGYGVVTESNGATLTGTPSTQPVQAGDTIVIYAIGLGPTSPVVPSGTASPGSPGLAEVPGTTKVCFGVESPFYQAPCVTASFVGLTPDASGLYQITATIPSGLKSGVNSMLLLLVDNIESTPVPLSVK